MRPAGIVIAILLILGGSALSDETSPDKEQPFLIILGTLQDAGAPHAACSKECCARLFENPDPDRMVVSLGVVDPEHKVNALFEATPDLPRQMKILHKASPFDAAQTPSAIFLTHAHIGHYTGLMFLGFESMNASAVPVFAMPRMKQFLESNGPWGQLVRKKNIALMPLKADSSIMLSPNIHVTPLLVPHRDEYSETVGYRIEGPNKKALFIPDIDKWEKWERSIVQEVRKVDYAFLDATFFDGDELNLRDMSQVPHPFVVESMALFESLPPSEKKKIYFIHFNHTNVLFDEESLPYKTVLERGFDVARLNQKFGF